MKCEFYVGNKIIKLYINIEILKVNIESAIKLANANSPLNNIYRTINTSSANQTCEIRFRINVC